MAEGRPFRENKTFFYLEQNTMKLGLLLALKSITAVKFTNDFLLKFWPNLTDEYIDEIAHKNGYINQETSPRSREMLG